ncbi:pyridoxamine 5'-phosphate oxidase family protein [Glycomyces salinus]|uniref:pyridoxamine 5'-phosphate oxidase family protein n=1 Tax=Glycomyces salinus TaxID=980294 RepID=UPI0018EA74B7|nr:pyridoxamine 5'-phosphate oxidase family protein [Glycomyces salinus]
MENKRAPVELDPKLALGLLGHAEFGRVAFVFNGVPTIRPLNHVVVDGRVIVYTRHSSAFAREVLHQSSLQVAYQADEIEPHSRLGWSVLITGTATVVSRERHSEQLGMQVRSWLDRPLDTVIAIRPREISGLRLTIGK